jgi:transposase InsO family protein
VSRYRFIAAEKATYPIVLLCRVLGVSRAGYYAWTRRGPSARAIADAALLTQIQASHRASHQTYGAPRIHAALRRQGQRCGRKRVARLMRASGLTGCHRRRRTRTTVSDPAQPAVPNRLERRFSVAATNRVWVGDITYLPTWQGWLYLAVLIDLHSRRVVGWAMADHLRSDLAAEALAMAVARRQPAAGLLHHTDRGVQYTAGAYQTQLADHGIVPSMSRVGDCYDNAVAESFFATLKTELVDRTAWPTRRAAQQAVFEWIEVFYNRQRCHSTLAYRSPVDFEADTVRLRMVA